MELREQKAREEAARAKSEAEQKEAEERERRRLSAVSYRAQADALEIEALAKRRLADGYDAAQEQGEVATQGRPKKMFPDGTFFQGNEAEVMREKTEEELRDFLDMPPAPLKEMPGLTRKDIFEARQIRDAGDADPGLRDPHPRRAPGRRAAEGLAEGGWRKGEPRRPRRQSCALPWRQRTTSEARRPRDIAQAILELAAPRRGSAGNLRSRARSIRVPAEEQAPIFHK